MNSSKKEESGFDGQIFTDLNKIKWKSNYLKRERAEGMQEQEAKAIRAQHVQRKLESTG